MSKDAMYNIEPEVVRDKVRLVFGLIDVMLDKLYENEAKPDFNSYKLAELHSLLDEEVEELQVELNKRQWSTSLIRSEAADVANICAMLVLFCNNIDNPDVIREINNEEE